jgi:hypothetical protein
VLDAVLAGVLVAVELPPLELPDELEAVVEVVDDFVELWLVEDFAAALFEEELAELAGGGSAAAVVAVSPSFL